MEHVKTSQIDSTLDIECTTEGLGKKKYGSSGKIRATDKNKNEIE
jgi:hypothetical protein